MGCLHIHIRKGKILKVAQHDFHLLDDLEQEGILHIEDNKHLTFFDFKTFEKNHVVDHSELNDIPYSDRYDKINESSPFIEGISLCPRCEIPISHKFKLEGAYFVGLQSFKILKKCAKCQTSWIAEINVLATDLPTYHIADDMLIPDESTARRDYLNALQETIQSEDSS